MQLTRPDSNRKTVGSLLMSVWPTNELLARLYVQYSNLLPEFLCFQSDKNTGMEGAWKGFWLL